MRRPIPIVPPAPAEGDAVRSAFSTFPPTSCGIATFSAALATGLIANGGTVDVVRTGSAPVLEDPSVVASLEDGSPSPGGGFDGLQPASPNLNQGAESTLALISTFQHACLFPAAVKVGDRPTSSVE